MDTRIGCQLYNASVKKVTWKIVQFAVAVTVLKDHQEITGHVPRTISLICSVFLKRGSGILVAFLHAWVCFAQWSILGCFASPEWLVAPCNKHLLLSMSLVVVSLGIIRHNEHTGFSAAVCD